MFHVPQDRFRVEGMGGDAGQPAGAFILDSCEPGWLLALIADDGRDPDDPTGWEHVSVRAFRGRGSRIPTWKEMCQVKRACWDASDVVMQIHPAESSYINQHPHVLHLWAPVDVAIPLPPIRLV